MRNGKRCMAMLLSLTMCASLVAGTALAAEVPDPAAEEQVVVPGENPRAASGVCGEALSWNLDDAGVLTISGTGDMSNYDSPDSVPWSAYTASIASVVIGDGVTSIGACAFENCANLSSVTIPASVTSINANAFTGCSALTEVTYTGTSEQWASVAVDSSNDALSADIIQYAEDSVTPSGSGVCGQNMTWTLTGGVLTIAGIGDMYDYDRGGAPWSGNWFEITSVVFEAADLGGVTGIGAYAFADCVNLTSVTIPGSVTRIGSGAFYGCTSLTDIYYTGSTAAWPSNGSDGLAATVHCADGDIISAVSSPSDFEIQNGVLVTYLGQGGVVSIPDGVVEIGARAFEGSAVTSVMIPDSVTTLNVRAFKDCASLTSVSIGSGLNTLGSQPFLNCSSMSSITVSSANSTLFVEDNVLFGLDVKSIDAGILYGGASFKLLYCPMTRSGSYVIPSDVSVVGECAFENCTGLTDVTIPRGVTELEFMAFSGCSGLTYINIPDNVVKVGAFAFEGCTSAVSITIGSGLSEMGDGVFGNCTLISDFDLTSNRNFITIDGVLYTADMSRLVCYPAGKAGTEFAVPNSVTYLSGAFCGNASLVSIYLPSGGTGITVIGQHTFDRCTSLRDVLTLREGITYIGWEAFSHCESMSEMILPEGLIEIEEGAFAFCANLSAILIPQSVVSIGGNAFYEHSSDLTIYGVPGSYAETYARMMGIYFLPSNNLADGSNCSVTLYANNGSGDAQVLKVAAGVEISLPENPFTPPEGQSFVAWSIDGQQYQPGAAYTFDGDVSVSAVWSGGGSETVQEAVEKTQGYVGAMTPEQKQNPDDVDMAVLYAEEYAAMAAVKVSDTNRGFSVDPSLFGSELSVPEQAVAGVTQALVDGGVEPNREMFRTVVVQTDSDDFSFQVSPSLLNTNIEKVRVEGNGFAVILTMDELAPDLTSPITISLKKQGDVLSLELPEGGLTNPVTIAMEPAPGENLEDQALFEITEESAAGTTPSALRPDRATDLESGGKAIPSKANQPTNTVNGMTSTSTKVKTGSTKNYEVDFTDISGLSADVQDMIRNLASIGIIQGTSDTKFSPSSTVSRAEVATWILRVIGKENTKGSNVFQDVKTSDWYYSAAISSHKNGLITGYSDGRFAGGETIKKDQITVVAARALSKKQKTASVSNPASYLASKFSDASAIAQWARAEVAVAAKENITTSVKGAFAGDRNITRSDAVQIISALWKRIHP